MRSRTRKLRRGGGKGGGCGCDLLQGGSNGENVVMKLGPKAKSFANTIAKTFRNRDKKFEARAKAKREAERETRRRAAFVEQNVSHVLANTNNTSNFLDKLIANPEYADEICEKFCTFLEKLDEIQDEAYGEQNWTLHGEVSNKKAEIAQKLVELFGKPKGLGVSAAAAAANHTVVNNFGANLANILSGLRL